MRFGAPALLAAGLLGCATPARERAREREDVLQVSAGEEYARAAMTPKEDASPQRTPEEEAALLREAARQYNATQAGKGQFTTSADEKRMRDSEKLQANIDKAVGKAIRITADGLLAAYRANEVGADLRFKNRRIAVSGTMARVAKTLFNIVSLDLVVENPLANVRCMMGREIQPEVAGLAPGQAVVVIGDGGGMVLGSPLVTACKLIAY
jgi:hypothetical protein